MTNRISTDAVRDRLDTAVAASGRKVSDLEAAAGLKRDGLRDFLARRKTRIGFVEAACVASELGVSLNWLAGVD